MPHAELLAATTLEWHGGKSLATVGFFAALRHLLVPVLYCNKTELYITVSLTSQ